MISNRTFPARRSSRPPSPPPRRWSGPRGWCGGARRRPEVGAWAPPTGPAPSPSACSPSCCPPACCLRSTWSGWPPPSRASLTAAAVLSQLEFPFRYSQLRHLDWVDISVLTCRNLLLVAACVLTVRAFGAGAPKVEQTVPEEGPEVVPATPG